MTKAELIAKLEQFPDDTPLKFLDTMMSIPGDEMDTPTIYGMIRNDITYCVISFN